MIRRIRNIQTGEVRDIAEPGASQLVATGEYEDLGAGSSASGTIITPPYVDGTAGKKLARGTGTGIGLSGLAIAAAVLVGLVVIRK